MSLKTTIRERRIAKVRNTMKTLRDRDGLKGLPWDQHPVWKRQHDARKAKEVRKQAQAVIRREMAKRSVAKMQIAA